MNGDSSLVESMQSALNKTGVVDGVEVLICPPSTLLAGFTQSDVLSLGAQNVSEYESGAYTGELSVDMIKNAGCQYALVGHSERREIYKETNDVIASKFLAITKSDLTPVLCVGEKLEDRESGNTETVLKEQLDAVLNVSTSADWEKAVIAYEPVWAIGTGKTATPEMAQDTHKFIREYLSQHSVTKGVAEKGRILYGGSMKPENAKELIGMPDIDGGLIGGASLSVESFLSIIHASE